MPANFTPSRTEIHDLKPFRYWCQKVLPLVYEDSLSYYELLSKVIDYLNKSMEDIGTLNDDITNMYTAYEELQDYVNHYFDSADFQAYVDAKLDKMARDGTLTGLIVPLMPPIIENWLNAHITEPTGVVVDKSLRIEGACADAEATGNQVRNLLHGSYANYPSYKLFHGAITVQGVISPEPAGTRVLTKNLIPIYPGCKIGILNPSDNNVGHTCIIWSGNTLIQQNIIRNDAAPIYEGEIYTSAVWGWMAVGFSSVPVSVINLETFDGKVVNCTEGISVPYCMTTYTAGTPTPAQIKTPLFVQGGFDVDGSEYTSSQHVRSEIISADGGWVLCFKKINNNIGHLIYLYDDANFSTTTLKLKQNTANPDLEFFMVPKKCFIRIGFIKLDSSNITPSEVMNTVIIVKDYFDAMYCLANNIVMRNIAQFNANNYIGRYVNTTGGISENANFSQTDYIPVSTQQKYKVPTPGFFVPWFDAQKQFIGYTASEDTLTNPWVTPMEGASYGRFIYFTNDLNYAVYSTDPKEQMLETRAFIEITGYTYQQGVVFGTSISSRSLTADMGSYLNYLCSEKRLSVDIQAQGSACLYTASGEEYPNIITQIDNYSGWSGKRFCFLEGFVNDFGLSHPLGTYTDTAGTNTVCACLKTAINKIKTANSNITLIVIFDSYGKGINAYDYAVNNLTQYQYYEELIKVCEYMGIYYIPVHKESGIGVNIPDTVVDNIHLTAKGAKIFSDVVAKHLSEHLPILH